MLIINVNAGFVLDCTRLEGSGKVPKSERFRANFAWVFGANFTKKRSEKTVDFVGIFWANFTRNQSFCADQTSVFNVFLTEVIICSFNNKTLQKWPMAKPLIGRLVPSFSQHNLRLVVSGCCLHISVTKFEDKFASLRQVNSPNS